MAVKKATTRRKIVTLKLTESEVILLREFCGGLEYKEDPRTQSALYVQLKEKLWVAFNYFTKYT